MTISSRPTTHDEADDDDQDALLGQCETEQRHRLDIAAGEELVAATEHQDDGVLQDQRDAEGREHAGLGRRSDDPLHHEIADHDGDDGGGNHTDHDCYRIRQVEIFDGEPGPEGAEHIVFAMREVDGAQHAKNHRHADRNDRIDRS
ncbi:hypothetical protein BRDID11002_12070 [Bradyrhizobium diazoefficiens]